jgi:hypothetical protein
MRNLSEYVSDVIKKIGGANNINKIFKLYGEIKEDIKKDIKRLKSTKHSILSRLQYGVFKLL